MSSFVDRFATNKEKEIEGIWYTVHENEDGTEVQFQISRMGTSNPKFTKALEKLTKPYRSTRTMPNSLILRLSKKAYIETCIHGWKNVDLGNGDGNLGFNQENLIRVCNALPDVLDLLMEVSIDSASFQDTVEEDVKN